MADPEGVNQQLTKELDVSGGSRIYGNKSGQEYSGSDTCKGCIIPIARTTFSIVGHFAFLICMGLIIWSRRTELHMEPKEEAPNYYLYYLIASICAGGIYMGLLFEAASSETCTYLKHYSVDLTAEGYIERVRDARPVVRWQAVCYHYEICSQGQVIQQGSSKTSRRGREKLITCRENEAFEFSRWRDLTRDIKGLFRMPVMRMECSKMFLFRDENSKARYLEQYMCFRERNRRRDEFMEHEEVFSIPGYRDLLSVCSDLRTRPWWMRESVYWAFTVLLLTWPYRIFFTRRTTKLYVVFIKELEV